MQRSILVDDEYFTVEDAEKYLKYIVNELEKANYMSSEKFDHLKKKAEKFEEQLGY